MIKEQIMQLLQKPECIDLMLHDDLKDDYPFRTNIQDIASLLSGILNIMASKSY